MTDKRYYATRPGDFNMEALTLRNRAANPKYKPGERKGKFVVLEYLGYGSRHIAKNHHWYKVICDCDTVEEINQRQLATRNYCVKCADAKRPAARKKPEDKPEPVPVDVVAALRARW